MIENHPGTFSGCVEILTSGLEDLLNLLLRKHVPCVVLDHRTNASKKLRFLRGQEFEFYVIRDGKEHREAFSPPSGGVFLRCPEHDAGLMMEKFLERRNDHVHKESLYYFVGNFSAISLRLGAGTAIFSPTSTDSVVALSDLTETPHDMIPCELNFADLTVEFVADTYSTHCVVLFYGREKYSQPLELSEVAQWKHAFGYDSSYLYFRFQGAPLLQRLVSVPLK